MKSFYNHSFNWPASQTLHIRAPLSRIVYIYSLTSVQYRVHTTPVEMIPLHISISVTGERERGRELCNTQKPLSDAVSFKNPCVGV